MRMADFIEQNLEPILSDWEQFAAELEPAAAGLTKQELRNLAGAILRSIAEDIRMNQSEAERHRKSLEEPNRDGGHIGRTGRGHAAERLGEGFTLQQLVAEYRALRASVIRQWRETLQEQGDGEVEELTRFNEAVDESLVEAVGWYHARIEDARDLLNGVLAHDLRGPLESLLIGTRVLMDHEAALEADQLRSVVLIRNSGERMRALINDLLDFTRTRLGTGLPIAAAEADLGLILRRICDELRMAHPEADIRCEASGDLAGVWDGGRIEQMLANLIENAVTHGRQRRPVRVLARADGDDVVVEVHNEHGGIPEEMQEVIFDPLRRAARSDTTEGLAGYSVGLGLYIARQIVEAHNGFIELASSQEDGTTFTVRLPRRRRDGAHTAGLT
ncbi:MAG TPA: HAMP domain-containing sensor histidine kinase [Woeseiaceae bacterium]|nr:HAMP domain-containing sensor histidine kinase [Woeseiaceae bacterium]